MKVATRVSSQSALKVQGNEEPLQLAKPLAAGRHKRADAPRLGRQPVVQPVNVEPEAGVAVSVSLRPWSNAAVQVAPQSIPAGDEVTVPLPVPSFVTVIWLCGDAVEA